MYTEYSLCAGCPQYQVCVPLLARQCVRSAVCSCRCECALRSGEFDYLPEPEECARDEIVREYEKCSPDRHSAFGQRF